MQQSKFQDTRFSRYTKRLLKIQNKIKCNEILNRAKSGKKWQKRDFFKQNIVKTFVVRSKLVVVSGDGVSARAPGGEGAEAGGEGPEGRGSRHQPPPPTSDTRLCDPLGGGQIEVSAGLRVVSQCPEKALPLLESSPC